MNKERLALILGATAMAITGCIDTNDNKPVEMTPNFKTPTPTVTPDIREQEPTPTVIPETFHGW